MLYALLSRFTCDLFYDFDLSIFDLSDLDELDLYSYEVDLL